MISLQTITYDNLEAVLALRMTDEQKGNVDTSMYSLARGYVKLLHDEKPPMIFALCANDEVVGYVDIGYFDIAPSSLLYEKFGDTATYGINRLLIDWQHQGKGLGKQALQQVIAYIQTMPQGKANAIATSYWFTNEAARNVFAAVGFVETGAIWDGDTGEAWASERTDMENAEVGARFAL